MIRWPVCLGLLASAVVLAGEPAAPGPHNGTRPVIFVKTHKTGGSTVATLLHRFSGLHQFARGPCFAPPPGLDAHRCGAR
jgi:hypothetical protein